jgi:hypothetical protein
MRMAVAVKRIDASLGDIVAIGERRYEVVDDREGGLALEPAIGPSVDELHARHGERRLTPDEFDRHFGDLPSDEEG